MRWIGMDIDFIDTLMQRHFIVNAKKLVNVRHLEITHLKCLGDVVLDYVVTTQLYFKYSRLILRLITYLRSTFLNNECSTQSEVKASMLEHIVHAFLGRYVVLSRNLRNWISCPHLDGIVKLHYEMRWRCYFQE
uniref:RNase III domain-containing protein n=1 Tax=Solanum lycopersicum TaxID=4081 RepID=K4AU01_SOLLC